MAMDDSLICQINFKNTKKKKQREATIALIDWRKSINGENNHCFCQSANQHGFV